MALTFVGAQTRKSCSDGNSPMQTVDEHLEKARHNLDLADPDEELRRWLEKEEQRLKRDGALTQ